jgi:hypothetical protein
MSATKILESAEHRDGYRAACKASPPNAEARRVDKYVPYFLSPDEAHRLRAEISYIDLLNESSVVVLHSSADNGYPHTRPNDVVCMPENTITGVPTQTLRNTLRHEAMHIHQRRYPTLWKNKCIHEGWKPIPTENIPKRFRDRCRINPDTMYETPFWAWQSYHVPLPMFEDSKSLLLKDVRIEWMDLRTNAIFHEPPKSFTDTYGTPSQPEHPYEIYAVNYANEGLSSNMAVKNKLLDLF